ncbi:Calcium-transporting ATPase 1 [compost metagenome]
MLYYNHSAQATLTDLDSSLRGLSNSEAEERLKQHGPNTIRVTGEPLWRKLIEPFANIFMLVLFVAAVISVLHGDTLDAIIVITIMFVSASIYYVQRFSTERILRSLQKHTAQNVETLRDGHLIQIDTSQLVPGDIISLGEGDKVPADLRFLTGTNVRIDESLLTGESVPIAKQAESLKGEKEIYERSNLLFQGSFVISGDVTAVVTKTGNDTEFGQLAALTQDANTESPVQKKIDKLISHVIAIVGGVAVVAFALALRGGMELGESLRFVLALSVSAVPESLPVAISVVLVLGMRRMAAKKALVRSMRAIETIGVLTTIATDKTGTLTKNKLTVQEIWHPEGTDKVFTTALAHAINQNGRKVHDPLDTAMSDFVAHAKVTLKGVPLLSLPFDQAVAMSGNLWHDGANYRLIVKGAPEHVLARSDLTENEHEQASAKLHHLTGQGYRVIAIAETKLATKISSFEGLPKRAKLDFIGFIAVADVLRPEAKQAIAAALSAGVTVRMITGDHFETAYHIGRQLGMVTHRNQVFDSRRMSVMSDSELDEIIRDVRVFSRVIPEHKYRILSLLKKHNITAMTGDGVNDVPALSNAHVGVAMGSGSQIAKDAGDIILLDDNFRSIIDAMHEGRTIFANIRRMLFYLLSTSSGEVLTMLGALAIGMPLPIVTVQILWINLVTDTAMVIPLGLEPGEKSNMKNKPKRINEPILSKFIISRMILIALSMAILTLSLYAIFSSEHGHNYGSTIAFSALVVMQWSNAFNARSDYESIFRRLRVFNGKFYIGLAIAVTLQMLAVFGPLQSVLHVTPVAIGDLIITGVIAFIVPILLSEIHKFIGRRYFHKGSRR